MGPLGGTPRSYWLTYPDVRFMQKALQPLKDIPFVAAAGILDLVESDLHEATRAPMLQTLAHAYRQAIMTARTSALAAAQKGQAGPRGPKGEAGKAGQPGKAGKAGKAGKSGNKEPKPTPPKAGKGKGRARAAEEEYVVGKRYIGGNPLGPPCRAHAKASDNHPPWDPLWDPSGTHHGAICGTPSMWPSVGLYGDTRRDTPRGHSVGPLVGTSSRSPSV